jgi:hypothetical protein
MKILKIRGCHKNYQSKNHTPVELMSLEWFKNRKASDPKEKTKIYIRDDLYISKRKIVKKQTRTENETKIDYLSKGYVCNI